MAARAPGSCRRRDLSLSISLITASDATSSEQAASGLPRIASMFVSGSTGLLLGLLFIVLAVSVGLAICTKLPLWVLDRYGSVPAMFKVCCASLRSWCCMHCRSLQRVASSPAGTARHSSQNDPNNGINDRQGLSAEHTCSEKTPLREAINMLETVPKELRDPILHDLVVDPVIGVRGHTYSRHGIETWLSRSNREPLTNEICSETDWVPNTDLKWLVTQLFDSCAEYCASFQSYEEQPRAMSIAVDRWLAYEFPAQVKQAAGEGRGRIFAARQRLAFAKVVTNSKTAADELKTAAISAKARKVDLAISSGCVAAIASRLRHSLATASVHDATGATEKAESLTVTPLGITYSGGFLHRWLSLREAVGLVAVDPNYDNPIFESMPNTIDMHAVVTARPNRALVSLSLCAENLAEAASARLVEASEPTDRTEHSEREAEDEDMLSEVMCRP
eukprot:SAG31_NODE_1337_length_8738_cov_2.840954_9_plen_449_part_00